MLIICIIPTLLILYRQYTYINGVFDSVGQPKDSKPKVPCSTPGSKNLINDKSKHNNKMLLFVFYCPEPLQLFKTCISL